jgi:hypothetical protein
VKSVPHNVKVQEKINTSATLEKCSCNRENLFLKGFEVLMVVTEFNATSSWIAFSNLQPRTHTIQFLWGFNTFIRAEIQLNYCNTNVNDLSKGPKKNILSTIIC